MSKIVGIGACVMDTLIEVPYYPPENTKLRAVSSKPAGGGPVATGLVAAQKLGIDSGFIGVLSDDNGGKFLLDDFKKYNVNTDEIDVKAGFRSFTSTIWLSEKEKSRTCVFDKGNLPPLTLSASQKEAIKQANILMVDGNEMSATVEAAEYAHKCGTKVLYDAGGLYDGVEKLLPFADILIPSEEFALKHTSCAKPEDVAVWLYKKYNPEVVVITMGKNGGILYDGNTMITYPIYPADVVDSNGAGDVFHGAFVVAVTNELEYEKCCHFASATSALKCTGIGARESVPDYKTVEKFLKENGYEL